MSVDLGKHRPHRHSKRGHRKVDLVKGPLVNQNFSSDFMSIILGPNNSGDQDWNYSIGSQRKRDLYSPPAAILRITEDINRSPQHYFSSDYTSIKSSPTLGVTFSGRFLRLVRPMANLTKYVGDNAKFKCEVEGQPLPRYTWYRNEAVLNKEVPDPDEASSSPRNEESQDEFYDQKYSIKSGVTNSILRLRNLEIYDRGFYRCEAENGIKSVQTTGWLYVNPGENPLNQEGAVLPKYPELSFDEPGSINENLIMGNGDEEKMPTKAKDLPGDFDALQGQGMMDSTLEEAKIKEALHFDRSTHSSGKCVLYSGQVCREVFGTSPRNIFLKGTLTQDQLESNLKESLNLIESFDQISQQCSRYTLPVLCHKTFPQCANPDALYSVPRPRLLCKDECVLLENQICQKEYTLAKEQALIRHHLQTCHILPEIMNEGGIDCIRLGLINPDIIIPGEECFENPQGIDYKGTQSTTKSGFRCKKWSSFRKTKLSLAKAAPTNSDGYRLTDTEQLIASADHNFCRNPGGTRNEPWCFTDDNLSYEPCSIPKCGSSRGMATNGMTQKLLITLPSLGLLFGLIAILFLVCWCQKKQGSSKKLKNNPYGNGNKACVTKELLSNTSETIPLQPGGHLQNSEYPMSPKFLYKDSKIPEIPFSNLNFLQELGESNFGMVFKGELKPGSILNPQPTFLPIAIKSLKPIANPNLRRDFEKEIEILTPLKHPNITAFLGICHQSNLTYAIFEFLSKGDLHEFLLLRSPHSDVGSSSVSDATHHSLDQADFLYMAVHIACGMEYLSDNGFVHKDLAARNCIVGDNLLLKISNLGYASQAYGADYYKVAPGKQALPVRWMSPEAIQYGKYSTETDVWTFGILLWEMFSYGLQPYYGYTNSEVVELIKNQQLLSTPDDCPLPVYEIMLECWSEMPSRRPSFQSLHSRLRSIEIRDKSIRARSTTMSSGRKLGHPADPRYLAVTSPRIRARPPYYVTAPDDVRVRNVVTSQSPFLPQVVMFRDEGSNGPPTPYYHHVIPPAPRHALKPPPYGHKQGMGDQDWLKQITNGTTANPYSQEESVISPIQPTEANGALFYARSHDLNKINECKNGGDNLNGSGGRMARPTVKMAAHNGKNISRQLEDRRYGSSTDGTTSSSNRSRPE